MLSDAFKSKFSSERILVFVTPPCTHTHTHSRWWAWSLIKGLSPEEMLQVRAKVATLECLKGQRADLGLQRAWEGNYLVSVCLSQGSLV